MVDLSIAQAGFRLPDYVFRSDRLKNAQAKARSEGKPLTFLLTNSNTTCGLATAASLDIIRELSDASIIVYVDSTGRHRLPRIVNSALKSPESGRYIPKTAIVNAAITKVISIVPYVRNRGERIDLLAEARRKARRHKAPGSSGTSADSGPGYLLEFRWKGYLKPMPLIKLSGFFKSMGYKSKLQKSGPDMCRFKVTLAGESRERLQSKLQTFLDAHYVATPKGPDGRIWLLSEH